MTGWTEATLGDVCHVYQPQTLAQKQLRPGPFPVYGANGQIGWHDEFNHEGGQLLIGCRGSVGFVHVTTERAWVNGNAMVVLPREGVVERDFLAYALRGGVNISTAITGAAQPQITRTSLTPIPIAFPRNLGEQRRIVAILDEVFEAIATAKANTEKNVQNVRALLDLTRRDMFASLADEHVPTTLGRCCTFENGDRGKNYPGKEHRVAHGVPFINAGHLTEDGLDFSQMDYISEERFELLGNGKIRPRDVLFCLRGSLGKFACVDDLGRGAIASSLVILRPVAGLITDYLLEFLASTQCADQIEQHKGGAAQPNLGAQDLKRFELPLPPIDMQEATATRLASLRAAVSDAGALLSTKLAAFDELKKSLLHQAFTGQLTAKSTDQQLEAVA